MQNVLALHSGKAKDAFNNTGTLAERRKYAKQKFQEQQDALEAQVDSKGLPLVLMKLLLLSFNFSYQSEQ